MPFIKAQAVLKRVLPESVFERLHHVATTFYYKKRGIADWVYYHLPRSNFKKRAMVNCMRRVRPYTMVGRQGLELTFHLVREAMMKGVGGCLVECGVARGGTAALMLLASPKSAWLFDSFEGLPASTSENGYLRPPRHASRSSDDLTEGHCLGTLDEVEEILFDKFGFNRKRVSIAKGWFQDTLPYYKAKVGDIALLRIDVDWYESTKCCLENLYDNVVPEGYIIIDDYALTGCRRALDEFAGRRNLRIEVTTDGRGGGYFVK